jgi:dCTP deaminase
MLGQKELFDAWKKKRIRFSPDIDSTQITIASIDLRLGYEFYKLQDRPGHKINPCLDEFNSEGLFRTENYSGNDALGKPKTFVLAGNEFIVGFTLEEVSLPDNLAASVEGRSRLARYGIAVHTTAPHIQPTFEGRIALEFYNHGPISIELRPGIDRVCQLLFYELKTPVNKKVAQAMSTFMHQKTAYERPTPVAVPTGT